MSTSNKSAIFSKLVISGCDVFVHHFDTVDGLTPICSESHLLVRFFSTKTSLILFTSSIIASFDCKNNDYFSFSLLFGNKFINFTLEYLNQIGYMNIIFTAKTIIDGNFALKEPVQILYCLHKISLYLEGGMYMLSVSKEISIEYSDLVELSRNGEKASFTMNIDKYLDSRVLDIFRNIEVYGGFQHGIMKVYYNEYLDLSWTDKAKNELLFSMRKSLNKQKKVLITSDNFSKLMLDKTFIPEAKVPYNFFREANSYLDKLDYISAYIHFYMILEYCFAKGKFSGEQKQNFKKSNMLKYAVLSTISMIKERNYDLYLEIKQECTDKHKELNFDSLIDIMYCYRGELSHATKRAVYEEKQELVKPITLFISSVCFSVCGNIKVYCDKFVSEDTRKRRVNDHIQELEKRLGLE